MIRLAAGLWVAAYLARLRAEAIPAYIVARGDGTAGAVVVKLNRLDGQAQAWHRVADSSGAPGGHRWAVMAQGPEAAVDAALSRARGFDPDLWLIEVEDRAGRHLLDQPGLD